MGTDRVLFGSDWPHVEGLPEPLDYLGELRQFDDKNRRNILRDNCLALNTLRPGV
jgi:predicted TIM-barrel fold metal-dependent hydrolase